MLSFWSSLTFFQACMKAQFEGIIHVPWMSNLSSIFFSPWVLTHKLDSLLGFCARPILNVLIWTPVTGYLNLTNFFCRLLHRKKAIRSANETQYHNKPSCQSSVVSGERRSSIHGKTRPLPVPFSGPDAAPPVSELSDSRYSRL